MVILDTKFYGLRITICHKCVFAKLGQKSLSLNIKVINYYFSINVNMRVNIRVDHSSRKHLFFG